MVIQDDKLGITYADSERCSLRFGLTDGFNNTVSVSLKIHCPLIEIASREDSKSSHFYVKKKRHKMENRRIEVEGKWVK